MARSGTRTEDEGEDAIDGLTPQQTRALAALLAARDIQSAAADAGVGLRTLKRWLTEPAFQAALRQAEKDAIGLAVRRLAGVADTAVRVVLSIMADKTVSASVRLRAALGVLEQLVKLRELAELEDRIEAVEAQLQTGANQR
jgi:hypothetical protein